MSTGTAHTPAPRRAVFEDGFGKRHHAVGPGGEPLEVIEFRDDFAAAPSFEPALRERVSALVGFQNTCFARVRSVQRLGQNGSKLVVISDRVPGARLSTILAVAKQHLLPLEINAALCLIRQLVPAVAALHDKMPAVGHGTLTPERIIITPNARLVVVDQMLGGAVEKLNYSHDRYWKELRIPLPSGAQPTFDHRADVMQVGMVALALILGRPLDARDIPIRSPRSRKARGASRPPVVSSRCRSSCACGLAGCFSSTLDSHSSRQSMRGPNSSACSAAATMLRRSAR